MSRPGRPAQTPPPLPAPIQQRIAETEAHLTEYVRQRTGMDVTVAFVMTPVRPERQR